MAFLPEVQILPLLFGTVVFKSHIQTVEGTIVFCQCYGYTDGFVANGDMQHRGTSCPVPS